MTAFRMGVLSGKQESDEDKVFENESNAVFGVFL